MNHQVAMGFSNLPIETKGYELAPWQQEAVTAWTNGDEQGRFRGTLEVFTGGGKTLIAFSCIQIASGESPNLKVAIVVPTEALAHQWRKAISTYTNISPDQIGLLGAGQRASFDQHRVVIAVINTARKQIPELALSSQPLMLIIDECHRAGSPKNSEVLKAETPYRLGLSATPDREEIDYDTGELLAFDEQIVGRLLGSVVYRFGLKEARGAGWLPEYDIRHQGVSLTPAERSEYEGLSRKIDDLTDQLEGMGITKGKIQYYRNRPDELGQTVQTWTKATLERKDLLFRSSERHRVAVLLLEDRLRRKPASRVLVFNERVDRAEALFKEIQKRLPNVSTGLEHSDLPARQRTQTLDRFRSGEIQVLVSVKALIEGLDVPEIDIALSVASTSSVRQRIQSLGRALRRRFAETEGGDEREVHILYVTDSADEEIYGKEDWSDITGKGSNRYFVWSLNENRPREVGEAPRTPVPSEEQEWDRLGSRVPDKPVPWHGPWPETEYSVDTSGNVKTESGEPVTNPQGAGDLVAKVRKTPAGRFRVTPIHRLVLVTGEGDDRGKLFVVGQLRERFGTLGQQLIDTAELRAADLRPGVSYVGPATDEMGSFRIGKKRGGVIERKVKQGREFALTENGNSTALQQNARTILDVWKDLQLESIKFSVNRLGHAWYLDRGQPRFLAEVPGGFEWPS